MLMRGMHEGYKAHELEDCFFIACQTANEKMVRFLIDTASTYNPAFACVNYANEAGMRGIHYLCRGGHDVVQTNSLLNFLLSLPEA